MKLLIQISVLFVALFGFELQANGPDINISGSKINYTDSSGLRQGYWQITGDISIEEGYRKNQVIEEGEYLNNKREGLWKKYYPTGSLRSEINYSDNHPYGDYKTYYPEGNIEEEGTWLSNRNIGTFKRYHENGKIAQEFNFNTAGKREGEQTYYYATGVCQMKVELDNGVVHGLYKTFYPDGSPMEEMRMTNGVIEEGSLVAYKPKKKVKTDVEMPTLPRTETRPNTTDKPNLAEFKESGFNTLYNKDKQVTQVGEFQEGRLWNGKWYRYNENGILKRVEVYKNGRFIGYGIIEDSNN